MSDSRSEFAFDMCKDFTRASQYSESPLCTSESLFFKYEFKSDGGGGRRESSLWKVRSPGVPT